MVLNKKSSKEMYNDSSLTKNIILLDETAHNYISRDGKHKSLNKIQPIHYEQGGGKKNKFRLTKPDVDKIKLKKNKKNKHSEPKKYIALRFMQNKDIGRRNKGFNINKHVKTKINKQKPNNIQKENPTIYHNNTTSDLSKIFVLKTNENHEINNNNKKQTEPINELQITEKEMNNNRMEQINKQLIEEIKRYKMEQENKYRIKESNDKENTVSAIRRITWNNNINTPNIIDAASWYTTKSIKDTDEDIEIITIETENDTNTNNQSESLSNSEDSDDNEDLEIETDEVSDSSLEVPKK